MLICPVCGSQCADDAAFCGACGANMSVVASGAPAEPPAGASWSAEPQPSNTWTPPTPPQPSPQQPAASQLSGTFVDGDETVQAAIGSTYLQNFLAAGHVSKGIGVLTQKRFYYKGKSFGLRRGLCSVTQEGVVSLEDISSTQFVHVRPLFLIVIGVLLAVADLVFGLFLSRQYSYWVWSGMPFPYGQMLLYLLPGAVLALFFFLLYFILRKHWFQIHFPGGYFTFNARWYPDEEIRSFQRTLHQLKAQNRDQYKS